MSTRTRTTMIALAALLAGGLTGVGAGFQLGANVTHRLSSPLLTGSAYHAYIVLSALERNEGAKAREFLEREVDSGIMMLESIASDRQLDAHEARVYEQLKEYRDTHPLDIARER